jgi:DNA-binding NtrC family response regulator
MKKARLLIIDDNSSVRTDVRERIESLGHEADEAAYQDEALRKLEEMQYDCVLLDLEIPVKIEGVAGIHHGRNLLERIVSMPDAPPVIVITSHGLDGHKLGVEMMRIGAKDFAGKPFDKDPLDPKIQRVLESRKNSPSGRNQTPRIRKFSGGVLTINGDGIELCDTTVGGIRSYAMIREVVQLLSEKKNGKFRKMPAKELAAKIASSPDATALGSSGFFG